MLDIYPVCIQLCRDCRPVITELKAKNRDLASQLERAVASIALNVAEGCGQRAGHRRERFATALGSAREVRAVIDVGEALGTSGRLDAAAMDRLGRIEGTLVKLTR